MYCRIATHQNLIKRKDDRLKAVKKYKEVYSKNLIAFLDESDWMSSEVSDLETEDEGKKLIYQGKIALALGR